jgi:hypothetical protein
MRRERWQQIREVLEKALEMAPGERSAFVNQACSSDQSLRQEIETLLASSPDVRSSFLQSSALADGLGMGQDRLGAVGTLDAGQVFAQRFNSPASLGKAAWGKSWLAEQSSPVGLRASTTMNATAFAFFRTRGDAAGCFLPIT